MKLGKTLRVNTRRAWRTWLRANHRLPAMPSLLARLRPAGKQSGALRC